MNCPSQDSARGYQRLCASLRAEFLRFDLGKRQHILAETLLELSFGWGNPSVLIPTWEVLAELTGLTAPNIHTSLTDLREMRIVRVKKADRGLEFSLQPNSDNWQCRPRQSRAQIEQALELVRRFNPPTNQPTANPSQDGNGDSVLSVDFVFPPQAKCS